VFGMVAQIHVEEIGGSIVVVGFLALHEFVVFGDGVHGQGMEAH